MGRIKKVEHALWEAHWVDGYLPSLEDLRRIGKNFGHLDRYGLGIAKDYRRSKDGLFESIAFVLRMDSHIRAKSTGHPCEIYLLKFDEKCPSPPFEEFCEESEHDERRDDYRHIVAVYNDCPVGERCLGRLIHGLQFELKGKNSYSNHEAFEKACYEMLDKLMSIFIAPCQVARDELQQAGFEAHCFGL